MEAIVQTATHPKIRPSAAIGFALVHLAAVVGVFYIGFSWKGVVLCVLSYYIRMFGVTAGFHRYFSHRTYKLNRFWQFAMAFLAETSAQKGVLWWSANHRHHHKFSDMPQDLHSPVQSGFWYSHMGWILANDYASTDFEKVSDLAKFPELRFLERNQYLPTLLYAIFLSLAFGPVGLFYGYFLSTALLWHGTFSINSVMHVFGRRVYSTTDDSRNSFIFALVTMGEGWHNNHHFYPGTAAQGFRWWQFDPSYYLLWIGEKVGIVKGLRRVPERLKAAAVATSVTTRQRFDTAMASAGVMMNERVEKLSARWAEVSQSAHLTADQVLADLEQKRLSAAARVEQLRAEYAAACARAGAAAEKKLQQMRREIDHAYAQLIEILEQLLRSVDGGLVPATA